MSQVQITASGVLEDLNQGLTRLEIAEKYNLSKADLARLFKNPVLKGRKTKSAPSFVFVDDVTQSAGSATDTTDTAASEETQTADYQIDSSIV